MTKKKSVTKYNGKYSNTEGGLVKVQIVVGIQ